MGRFGEVNRKVGPLDQFSLHGRAFIGEMVSIKAARGEIPR